MPVCVVMVVVAFESGTQSLVIAKLLSAAKQAQSQVEQSQPSGLPTHSELEQFERSVPWLSTHRPAMHLASPATPFGLHCKSSKPEIEQRTLVHAPVGHGVVAVPVVAVVAVVVVVVVVTVGGAGVTAVVVDGCRQSRRRSALETTAPQPQSQVRHCVPSGTLLHCEL
jgi:Flp pilus assembly protein TadB